MILLQKKQQKTLSQGGAWYLGGIRQGTWETSTWPFVFFFLADFESCRECLHLRRSVTNLHNCHWDHLKRQCHDFSSFSINWFRIVTVSSSDRWLDYLFTKPSEGSETKRLRLFRPLFHKLRMETRAIAFSPVKPVRCMHKIMLDCTLIFWIKTSKTAFSWLKTLNNFGCNRQGTEKRLKSEFFPSQSYTCTHVRTLLQQKRKHSWLCRRVGSCRKEPNCGFGWDVWKTYHAKSSLFPCLESWCTTRLAPGYSNFSRI